MKALVLLNGAEPERDLLSRHLDADIIYAADGAAEYARRYGIMPDVIVGDFDSADPDVLAAFEAEGCRMVKLNTEKNETDAQIACDMVAKEGADEVVLLGAIGGRLDHTLGNVQVLVRLSKAGVDARIEDSKNTVYALNGKKSFKAKKGALISIVPLGEETRITTEGLYYPLERHKMPLDAAFGISNVFVGEKACIISEGWSVVLMCRD
ncbi:MAG: thiamine diphosphokinase [Christensenellales bacterium]|jgi:thiamine pyrophosphokinase